MEKPYPINPTSTKWKPWM